MELSGVTWCQVGNVVNSKRDTNIQLLAPAMKTHRSKREDTLSVRLPAPHAPTTPTGCAPQRSRSSGSASRSLHGAPISWDTSTPACQAPTMRPPTVILTVRVKIQTWCRPSNRTKRGTEPAWHGLHAMAGQNHPPSIVQARY